MRATRSCAGIIERVVSVCAWGGFVISHVEITLKDGGYRRRLLGVLPGGQKNVASVDGVGLCG